MSQHLPNLDTAGRRYEQPCIFNPTSLSSGVMGVWLHQDEEVEWSIMTNPDGTQNCYGYTIKKKGVPTITCGDEISLRLPDEILDQFGF